MSSLDKTNTFEGSVVGWCQAESTVSWNEWWEVMNPLTPTDLQGMVTEAC